MKLRVKIQAEPNKTSEREGSTTIRRCSLEKRQHYLLYVIIVQVKFQLFLFNMLAVTLIFLEYDHFQQYNFFFKFESPDIWTYYVVDDYA